MSSETQHQQLFSPASRLIAIIALCFILLLAGYLRFAHVADNPAWYTDEGTHISIAHHLMQGKIQYFAVTDSMLLFARPPLFHSLLAIVSSIFGEGMETLRGFTAGLGVLSVMLMYAVLRMIHPSRYFALWGALLLAVYPQAVLYSRLGFSYAILTPMVLLICLWLVRYLQRGKWNFVALTGILAGIGMLGDIMMGAVIGVVGIIVFFKSPKMCLWLVPLMALPFGIYSGVMLIAHPQAYLFDFGITFGRLGGIPVSQQLVTIAENFTMLLSTDLWFPLGMVGIFLIQPPALRVVSICLLLLPIAIIGRTVALFHLSLYYMSPLFPLLAIGVASLTASGVRYLMEIIPSMLAQMRFIEKLPMRAHRLISIGVCTILIGAPLGYSTYHLHQGIQTRIQTAIDPFLVEASAGHEVIAFLQAQNLTHEALILASPGIGWALEAYTPAKVADWQMHIAYIGYDAIHLPASVPHDRYAFVPTLDHADFVIIDNIWRNWGNVHIPQAVVLHQIVIEDWVQVFTSGTLTVYARP